MTPDLIFWSEKKVFEVNVCFLPHNKCTYISASFPFSQIKLSKRKDGNLYYFDDDDKKEKHLRSWERVYSVAL